ncbi:RagB/SusD family nutrient uptake outer membrane protein [Chryseosolibacter indicus]|uniref:RagB/SusD family nutrient uptake outer membrane protein n=1 Tax=Chryseosolibacter indicus TaxID=2782351 RepID=A0ABS5VTT5_9BACT|nr:RagB/SusD family nutrient uptake outer membrane protein [Chryseosolibacter indicus]MBT1704621.1 RagB/SusD family nutrient uptake outer membrane protein [Chryseosolibacter indicus]
MKNINSAILIAASALVAMSCNDDFLERYPTASASPPTFFKTESDFRTYTNLFYSYLPGDAAIYGESADNIVKSSVDREIAGTRLVPTTDSKWDWRPLRSINFLLNSENVKNYKDAAIRDKYVGLARFFRAYFYFEKVKIYGDVPWYNVVIEPTDEANLYKPRDPRTLIMDSVLADINFAIDHLDAAKDVERVTKWTALALKSRICLYEGTWRKYHTEFNLPDADRFLNECVAASEALMNDGPYQVYTKTTGPSGKPYQDLFATLKLDPVADEVILGRRYSGDLGLKHGLQFYITSRTQGKPGLEKRLVNSYLMADGSRFTDIPRYDTLQFYDEVQNRDPRLAQTIRTPGYTRIGEKTPVAPDFEATMTGYQPIKWMNAVTYDGNNQSIQDLLLFRFGEVLLNYAEAKAELGILTQADIDKSIRLLRDRVGMPNLDVAEANALPDPYLMAMYQNVKGDNVGVILEIRRERRIELVMENGLRWEDLMRWKEGHLLTATFQGMYFPRPGLYDLDKNGTMDVEVYSGSKPPAKGPYQIPASDLSNGTKGNILTNKNIIKTFNELRDYLWPLPVEDRTLNPNLEQNPYWN